jgi:hypothetical protein
VEDDAAVVEVWKVMLPGVAFPVEIPPARLRFAPALLEPEPPVPLMV